MTRILMWTVPVDGQPHPVGEGNIVHIAAPTRPANVVHVWTEEEAGVPEKKQAIIISSGMQYPKSDFGYWRAVGTAINERGQAWHVLVFHDTSVQGYVKHARARDTPPYLTDYDQFADQRSTGRLVKENEDARRTQ